MKTTPWLTTPACIGLLLLGGVALSPNAPAHPQGDPSAFRFTPFTLIATAPAIGRRGRIDPVATYERARQIAETIAKFVATRDEWALGLASSNWVLGGAPEGADADPARINAAILDIPTPEPIDPSKPVSSTNTKKVNVLELCNKVLASKALGVLPVVGDLKVINGPLHGTALPCEVAVYASDREIRIEMLNAEAIFTLFFTDVLFGEQMMDPVFAEELQRLPAQVNAELPAIIYAALREAGIAFKATDRAEGPRYRNQWDVIHTILQSPFNAPYAHFLYSKANGEPVSEKDVTDIAQAIVNTLTVNGQPGAGVHDPELDRLLSPGSAWRSARPAPLSLPGDIKVIEGCSPVYAKQAMGTGLHHATALPCEIAVARTADGQLMVSYLDPTFMFKALFSDAFDNMTDEELAAFAELPKIVLADLQTIVAYTFTVRLPALGIELTDPVPYYHDVFPF